MPVPFRTWRHLNGTALRLTGTLMHTAFAILYLTGRYLNRASLYLSAAKQTRRSTMPSLCHTLSGFTRPNTSKQFPALAISGATLPRIRSTIRPFALYIALHVATIAQPDRTWLCPNCTRDYRSITPKSYRQTSPCRCSSIGAFRDTGRM